MTGAAGAGRVDGIACMSTAVWANGRDGECAGIVGASATDLATGAAAGAAAGAGIVVVTRAIGTDAEGRCSSSSPRYAWTLSVGRWDSVVRPGGNPAPTGCTARRATTC
jgi:hypothetical protein